jgi:hypothetical protein
MLVARLKKHLDIYIALIKGSRYYKMAGNGRQVKTPSTTLLFVPVTPPSCRQHAAVYNL